MVVDKTYYKLLGVPSNATKLEIKRAYRKQAVIHHPDKNPNDPTASERFQSIGEAYQVLSNSELRNRYDQYGKKEAIPAAGFEDPNEYFTKIFGGNAFSHIFGELTLMKDLTRLAELSGYTDENISQSNISDTNNSKLQMITNGHGDTYDMVSTKKKHKSSAAREAEIDKYEEERRKERIKRINKLTDKLIETLSLWTETDKQDDITFSFNEKIRYEAELLKLESFGIEILQTIGSVYLAKGENFIKSQKYFGVTGFFNSVKERGSVVVDTIKILSIAFEAQKKVQEITKAQEEKDAGKEIDAEHMAKLEKSVMGKVLSAAWSGSKFEIQGVLRDVCDAVLNEGGVSSEKKKERADALMMIGTIYLNTERTPEEAEESRIFEEFVATTSKPYKF